MAYVSAVFFSICLGGFVIGLGSCVYWIVRGSLAALCWAGLCLAGIGLMLNALRNTPF